MKRMEFEKMAKWLSMHLRFKLYLDAVRSTVDVTRLVFEQFMKYTKKGGDLKQENLDKFVKSLEEGEMFWYLEVDPKDENKKVDKDLLTIDMYEGKK